MFTEVTEKVNLQFVTTLFSFVLKLIHAKNIHLYMELHLMSDKFMG